MAMNANDLKDAMVKALADRLRAEDAATFFPSDLDGEMTPAFKTFCDVLCEVVAEQVIAHLKANAEANITVASGIAVSTTGTAAAQSGMTTANGVGTLSPGALR